MDVYIDASIERNREIPEIKSLQPSVRFPSTLSLRLQKIRTVQNDRSFGTWTVMPPSYSLNSISS